MAKLPEYNWNEESGTATCVLYYKNQSFIGEAQCHPDDSDMMNKMTGQTIAEIRALIKLLKFQKNCEIKPKLAALEQFYYSINRSKQFNSKSYENKMLYRQIQNYKFDLDAVNQEITMAQINLKGYLAGKEEMYKVLREYRKGQQ